MVRSREKFRYGPWPGGLNLTSDPQYLEDTELSYLLNLDVKDDGTLIGRAPIRYLMDNNTYTLANPANVEEGVTISGTATIRLLGKVSSLSADNTLILDGSKIKRFNKGIASPVEVTYTGVTLDSGYFKVIEYNDFAYFLNTNRTKWFRTTSNDAVLGGSATLVTAPTGSSFSATSQALMWKDRMFVFSNNRIYYSKATDPSIWAAPDGGFFDINPDTSNIITSFCLSNDTLYIFKKDQVWAFNYTSDPTVDGTLRLLSSDKGALYTCVYENVIYTTDADSVYVFANGQFQDIATRLNSSGASGTNLAGYSLWVWDSKLFVGAFGSMNLNTGAWTLYSTSPWQVDISRADRVITYDDSNTYGRGYALISGHSGALLSFMAYENVLESSYPVVYDSFKYYDGTIKYIRPRYEAHSKALNLGDSYSWKKLHTVHLKHGDTQAEGVWTVTPFDPTIENYAQDPITLRYSLRKGYFEKYGYIRNIHTRLLLNAFRFRDLVITYRLSNLYKYYDNLTDLNGDIPEYFYTYEPRDPTDEINFIANRIYINELVLEVSGKAEADV